MLRVILVIWGIIIPAYANPAIAFDPRSETVSVKGLDSKVLTALADPDAASRALRVYLGDADTAMLGDYEILNVAVRFRPRFPLLAGRNYRVVLDLRELEPESQVVLYNFRTDETPAFPTTRVTAIYPSVDAVPANLLRLYIYFSGPMSRRDLARQVQLIDEHGQSIERAFLETDHGLWDPEGHRLTLFFDPGRIKHGLDLRETMGLALRPGSRYRLIVSKDLRDGEGLPLVADFIKEFRVTPEDDTSPDVHKWTIESPRHGTSEALTVTAEKPLDHVLFARLLRVHDDAGRLVTGHACVEPGDIRWRFTPDQPWRAGEYVLEVDAAVEDLVGNGPTHLFEDAVAPDRPAVDARDVAIRFSIR
jgi:hypothetical protein